MLSNLTVSPFQNALDSLKRLADELIEVRTGNMLALKGALAWAWHVIDLLAYLRLQPHRQDFDPWMQTFLHEGEKELQIDRDAHWNESSHLSLLELIDLFSAKNLSMLKPEFYHGWMDRQARCSALRQRTFDLLNKCIDAQQRQALMLLLAVYNRLLHLPASVSLSPKPVLDAFPAMLNFIEMLIDGKHAEAAQLHEVLEQCRLDLQKWSEMTGES